MIVYVPEAEPLIPESTLHTCLNQIRNRYGPFKIRVDAESTPTARSALRWATLHQQKVQRDGIPDTIVLAGTPPDLRTATQQAKTVSNIATNTSGAPAPIRLLFRLLPPATVIWLDTPGEKNGHPPEPMDQPAPPPY